MQIENQARFLNAIAAFDAANSQDPNKELIEGVEYPKEVLYARRMTDMSARFTPDAPESVQLAVRAQHIQRWKIPRNDFPMDRPGYLRWRARLYEFHAETTGRILKEVGYDDALIGRVKAAVGKRGIKSNLETQMLEDVAALVFIEHYLTGFTLLHTDYDETKWADIIAKTWNKMSEDARKFVLSGRIKLPAPLTPLILRAVGK